MRNLTYCIWAGVVGTFACGGPSESGLFKDDIVETTGPATNAGGASSGTSAQSTSDDSTTSATASTSDTGTDATSSTTTTTSDGGTGGIGGSDGTGDADGSTSDGGTTADGTTGEATTGGTTGEATTGEATTGGTTGEATTGEATTGEATTGDVDTVPPSIVSVSPDDGASGVSADTVIVVTFSEAMDPDATQAAFVSETLSDVNFAWNAAGTELSITPESGLEYASIDTLDEPALNYGYEFMDGALDLAGNALSPAAFEFSTLRRLTVELSALGDLSGSRRSDNSSGAGNCAPGQDVVCAGDSVSGNSNVQYLGFISFDIAELPLTATVESASLSGEVYQIVGNPSGLGALVIEQVSFEAINLSALQADALSTVAILEELGDVGSSTHIDVSEALTTELGDNALLQFRIQFETATDADFLADALIFARESLQLEAALLVP